MLLAEMPISVVMQRRSLHDRWHSESWHAIAVVPGDGEGVTLAPDAAAAERYLVPGLRLELHPDENDGYYENWAAPQAKVFVMWQLRERRAVPVLASVSYAEGTRMFDSGDGADGVPMPPAVHRWLGAYLQQHYRPRARGKTHG